MKIILPKESLQYALFQREGCLHDKKFSKILTRIGRLSFLYKSITRLKCKIYPNEIITEFNKHINKDYSEIKDHLPNGARNILDIGCGIAAIDILINNHYNNNINISLLDKTKTDDRIYYFFEEEGSFYNSLDISKEVLEDNGVSLNRVFVQEATDDNKIKSKFKFDLVISLLSWGFHYPVSTYIDEVYYKMNKGGVLIMDVRSNTGGEDLIKSKFGNCEIINESGKVIKIKAIKQ